MRARFVVRFLLLTTTVVAAGAAGAAGTTTVPRPATVFAPTSFWYQAIPRDAPLHPNSAALAAEFVRQRKAYYGTVSINTTSYSSPVYVVGPDVPTVSVAFNDCQHKGWVDKALLQQWEAVPIPDYAQQADGTDAEMTIYQPSSDSLWEFWQAKKVDGKWQACWGGKLDHVSQNPGIWPNHYGTTATSLPFMGGQITPEELAAGEIKHAIGIALVDCDAWNVISWPATRGDGYNPGKAPNRIPEGLRFRLDPTLDLDTLRLHPIGKIIAKAAQTYGFVVWDKAGAITLRADNPKAYTLLGQPDPYKALFGGTPAYALMSGIPWERLQFLPVDYGKPVRHRVLKSGCNSGSVAIVAADGAIEWEYPIAEETSDSWLLPSGNVCFAYKHGAREVNRAKQTVWEYAAPAGTEIHTCQPLPGGLYLLSVAQAEVSHLLEIDRDLKVHRDVPLTIGGDPHTQFRQVRKTPRDTYLVTLQRGGGTAREYDATGKLLRTFTAGRYVAVPLPNGNTLLACGDEHRLLEVDAQDKVVWQIEEKELPGIQLGFVASVHRLRNGNTVLCNWPGHGGLPAGQAQVIEVTPDKRVVWQLNDPKLNMISSINVLDDGDVLKGESWR